MLSAGRVYPIKKMNKRAGSLSILGFSLVEMLLVIALMGILTALIAPGVYNSLSSVRLKTAAKKTVAVVRYARNQAVCRKKPFWLLVNKKKNQLTVSDQPLNHHDRFTEEAASTSPSLKVYVYPEGVIIGKLIVEDKEIDDPEGAFIFYPNGSCNGGGLLLQADNSRSYHITIDFITATATIESGENKTH